MPITYEIKKFCPPGYQNHRRFGIEANAYYHMVPYPYFGFLQWKTEELGPYPKCLPIAFAITKRSAIWLFGKPIQINFPGNKRIEKEIRKIIKENKFESRLVPLAQLGGTEGEVAVKFSYDPKRNIKVRLQVLSTVHQVEFFYDPHDIETVIMVRIQYPYQDPNDGKWYWYREEWTNELEVQYVPIEIHGYNVDPKNPLQFVGEPLFPAVDQTANWVVKNTLPNKFKVIPIVKLKNIDNGSEYGQGDLRGLFRVLDRINLAYHLMDKSNQLDVDPEKVYIDVEPKEGDNMEKSDGPGAVEDLQSVENEDGTPRKGQVLLLQKTGAMREQLTIYAEEMKNMLYDATGSVFPRQEHITNKGALTQSVLTQVYKPLLEVTDEKRKTYGTNGLCVLFQTMVIALRNIGADVFKSLSGSVNSLADEKLTCNITWFDQFMLTEDEKLAIVNRTEQEVMAGFLTEENAIKKISKLEEVELTDEDLEELKSHLEEKKENELNVNDPESIGGKSGTGTNSDSRKQKRKPRTQKRGVTVTDAE